MDESLEEFFLHTKPSRILVRLADPSADNYASALSKKVGCTYSHTVRIIQKLEEKGLVRTEKKGRKKEVELTEDGEEIAQAINSVLRAVN